MRASRAPGSSRTEVRIQCYRHVLLGYEEGCDEPPHLRRHLGGEDELRDEDELHQWDDARVAQRRHHDGRSGDGPRDRRQSPEDVHGGLRLVGRERDLDEGVVLRELQLQPGGRNRRKATVEL